MRKFLSRFALLGLFAGMIATSYALPAAAATADAHAQYNGATADDIIIIVIGDDYFVVVVWFGEAQAESAPGALSAAATDKMFDGQ
jgi:hypothetical protein